MEADTGAVTLWNHPAIFDYQDRYMAVTAREDSYPAWRTNANSHIDPGWASYISTVWATNTGWRAWNTFYENMWDEYRDDY